MVCMRVLIDADGFPGRGISRKNVETVRVEAVLICDTSHEYNRQDARVIIVSKGGTARTSL